MGATTFALTSMYLLTTLNGLGQLAGVENSELPAGMKSQFFYNLESCNIARAKMTNPLKYTCQHWQGQKTEDAPVIVEEPLPQPKPEPQAAPPANNVTPQKYDPANIQVQQQIRRMANTEGPEACEGRCLATATAKPKPKKIVRQRPQEQQFDPIGTLFAWITPRADW
jgi:hypothetical protein